MDKTYSAKSVLLFAATLLTLTLHARPCHAFRSWAPPVLKEALFARCADGKFITSSGLKVTSDKWWLAFKKNPPLGAGGNCPGAQVSRGFSETISLFVYAEHFVKRGFCCSVPNSETGMTCRGRVPGYAKDVVFFIPPGYRPEKQADLVLHLHGLMNFESPGDFENSVLGPFRFDNLQAYGGRRSILVVPQLEDPERGRGAYNNEFGKAPQFSQFMDGVNSVLGAPLTIAKGEDHIASLTVTAHSRGGWLVNDIVDTSHRDKIKELHLIDAAYDWSGPPNVAAFVNKRMTKVPTGLVFTNSWRDTPGADTALGTRKLQLAVCQARLRLLRGSEATPAVEECIQVLESYPAVGKPHFYRTEPGIDHYAMVSTYFPLVMAGKPPRRIGAGI